MPRMPRSTNSRAYKSSDLYSKPASIDEISTPAKQPQINHLDMLSSHPAPKLITDMQDLKHGNANHEEQKVYHCCNFTLPTAQDLLEHFGIYHVPETDQDIDQQVAYFNEYAAAITLASPKSLSPLLNNYNPSQDYYNFDTSGFSSHDVSPSQFNLLHHQQPNAGGYFYAESQPLLDYHSNPNHNTIPPGSFAMPLSNYNHIGSDQTPNTFISPNLLNQQQESTSDDDTTSFTSSERAYIEQLKGNSHVRRTSVANGLRETLEDNEKRYRCLIPGCNKIYRNQNGLKYHVEHNHTREEKALADKLVKAIREDPVERPFGCHLCSKRYRNTNGLKYHLLHHHKNEERRAVAAHDQSFLRFYD